MYSRHWLLVGFLLLAGCGANVLRLESAQRVSDSTSAMVNSADAAIALARQREQEAAATLVASDPSCSPRSSIQTYRRVQTRGRVTRSVPLCVDSQGPKLRYEGYEPDPNLISLRPVPQQSLKPTLLMIAAIGDYGAGLAKIVARPDADISKEIGDFAAKADSALALANALSDAKLPTVSDLLAKEQVKSALKLVEFANKLAEESRRVRDVSALAREHDAEIATFVPLIKKQLGLWLDVVGKGSGQVVVGNLVRAYDRERGKLTYDQRLPRVQQVMAARDDMEAWPMRIQTIDQALDKIVKSESELTRMLAGKFTKAERRRIASINADRIAEGMQLIASVIASWRGI